MFYVCMVNTEKPPLEYEYLLLHVRMLQCPKLGTVTDIKLDRAEGLASGGVGSTHILCRRKSSHLFKSYSSLSDIYNKIRVQWKDE